MNTLMEDITLDALVYQLKICYMDIYLEDKVTQLDNWFVIAITEAVQEGNEALDMLFLENPVIQYSTDTDETICRRFLHSVEKLVYNAAEILCYIQHRYEVTTDLVNIILPYILSKTGICEEEIGTFISLGIFLSRVAISKIADIKETEEKEKINSAIKNMCESNIDFLTHSINDENKNLLEKCEQANRAILQLIKEKEER